MWCVCAMSTCTHSHAFCLNTDFCELFVRACRVCCACCSALCGLCVLCVCVLCVQCVMCALSEHRLVVLTQTSLSVRKLYISPTLQRKQLYVKCFCVCVWVCVPRARAVHSLTRLLSYHRLL
jgi:hypothetical protein